MISPLKSRGKSSGIAIVAVLISAVVFLGIIIAITGTLSLSSRQSTGDQRVTLEAQYAAESGLSRVLADAQGGYLNAWTGLLFRLVTPNTTQESDIKALALKFCNLPATTVFVAADGCKAVNSGTQVADRYDVFANYLTVEDYTKVSMPTTVTLPTTDALEGTFWSDVFSDGPSGKRFSQTVGTNVKYDVTFGLEAVSVKVVDGNYQFRVKPRDAVSIGLYEANSKVIASRSSSRTFQDEYIIELRPPSFAYFLSLTNSQSQANADTTKPADDIYFDERTLLNGPVHTNGSYNFNGNTWLSDTVTSAGCTNPADLATCKPRAKVDNGNALTFDANGNPEFLGYTNSSSARPEFVDRNFDDQTLRTTYTSDGGATPWKYTGKYNAGVVKFPTTSSSQENDAKTGGGDTTTRGILVPAGTLSPAELLLPKEQRPVYPQIILQATADNFDSTASTETKFNTITSSTPASDKRKQLIRIVNRITRTNCAAPPTGITISPPAALINYPNPRFIDYTAIVTGQDDYSYDFAPTNKKVDSWNAVNPSTVLGSIVSTGKLTARYTTPSGYAMNPTPIKITATAGTFSSTDAILEVEAAAPNLQLSLSPYEFPYGGGTSTLSWITSGTGPFSYKIEKSIGKDASNVDVYTDVTTTTAASISVTSPTTTIYKVTSTGPTGLAATGNLTVTVNPPIPPKVTLNSSPSSLPYGGGLTRLSWIVTGSYSAANPMVLKLTNNQNATVTPIASMTGYLDVPNGETTRYVLAATGPGGFDSDYEDVTVAAPVAPDFTFDASPTSLPYGGGASKLTWSASTGASPNVTYTMTTVVGTITTGPTSIVGGAVVGGTMNVTPLVTTTYNVTATGPGGSLTKTQTVNVAPPIAPNVTLTTSVTSLPFGGGSTTLGWSSSVGTGPITYQVEASTDGGVTWNTITPAGSASGSQPVNLTTSTRYRVTATGGAGQTDIDSKDVTVAPPDPPAFTLKATPSNLPYLGGSSMLDWSGATGTGVITYQLERSTDAGATWTTLIGAGSSATSYPATLSTTTRYKVTATGKVGANVVGTTTDFEDVTVAGPTSPLVKIARNNSGTLVNGNNSTILSWSLVTTVPPASPTVTYRLEQKVGSGAWTTILGPNSTATTQTVTNLTANTQYKVTASSSAMGTLVGTDSLTLSVGAVGSPPNITSFIATPNSSTTTLNSVLSWTTINATSATLTRISGTGTVPTFNVPTPSVASGNTLVTVPTTTYYELTAINAFGETKRQVVVYIGTGTAPTVPVIPPPVINTFTATPASLAYGGGSSTLTWSISNANTASINQSVGSVNNVSGTRGVTVPNATTTYELSATNAGGTTKRTVTVTVAPAVVPAVTLNVPTKTYAYGGGTQTITWSATGTPTFAYQVQKSINGGSTWTDVVAAGSSLTSASVNTTQTTVYRAIAVGPGGTGYSTNQTVTVNPAVAPTVTLTPTPAVLAYGGGTTNLAWTASGTASINYQLEKSTNGGTSWSTLISAGSSLTSLNSVAVTSTTQFRVTATNLAGVNSDIKTVTVDAATPPTATLSIIPNSFVYGGGNSNLSWGVSAGTGPTFTYKVDKSTNGTTWTNIVAAGSLTTSLNNVNSSVTTQYRVIASGIGGNGEVIQNVTVAAAVAPTVNLTVPAATLPYGGGNAPLSWSTSAGTTPITYMLESSTNGGTTWTTLINAGSSATTYAANPTETTVYRVTAKGPTGLLDSDQKTVNVTLPTPPTLTLKGLPLSHTYGGGESTLTWSATGTGPITYALEKSIDGGTIYNSVAISSSALTFKETITKTTIYRVIATGVKNLKDSQTVTVTVGAPIPPTITSMTATANLPIGGGTSTVKWAVTGSAVITYKLEQSTNNGGTYTLVEDNMTVTQRDVNVTATTKFKLTATNAGGSPTATAITTVAPPLETLMSLNKTGLAKDENDQASATSFDPSWDVSPVFSTNKGGGNPTIVKADYSTSVTPADTNVDTGLPTLKAEVVNDSGKIMLTINRLPKGTPSRTYTVRVTLTKNGVSVFTDFIIDLSKNSSYTTLRPRARLTDTCADGSDKISYLWPEFTDYMVLEDGTYYQRVYPSGQQSSAVLPNNVPATAPWIKQNYKFNGVIYAYGPAGIQGPPRTNLSDPKTAMPAVASFAKMTFASASDIIINGDLLYESPVCSTAPERKPNGVVTPATCVTTKTNWKPNVLGIYTSSGNVNIRTQAKDPNTNTFKPLPNLAIQAITMASQGRVEVEGVLSTTASCPPLLNNASDKAGDLGSINIQGGLIQQSYGAFARIDNDATDKSWCGFDRTMTYDTRMRDPNRAPPSFPKADNAEWKTQIYLSSSPTTPLSAGKALPLTQGFSRNK